MAIEQSEKLKLLDERVRKVYQDNCKKVAYHGWHHVDFVRRSALDFGKSIKADLFLVESAALVHDLNYIVKRGSETVEGSSLASETLADCGYTPDESQDVERIVMEIHPMERNADISKEAKAVSDADNAYKALPITPVLFTDIWMKETKKGLMELTDIILSKQNIHMENGEYFYTTLARKRYLEWAKTNLELWNNMKKALDNPDVKELLEAARRSGALEGHFKQTGNKRI